MRGRRGPVWCVIMLLVAPFRPAAAAATREPGVVDGCRVPAGLENPRGPHTGNFNAQTPAGLAGSDWAAIRQVLGAAEHAVQRCPEGDHVARNPGQ